MNSGKDKIRQLIFKGKNQGYLLFEEIDKKFWDELHTGEDFDDFLKSIDDYDIKIFDKQGKVHRKRKKRTYFRSKGWKEQLIMSSST